MITYPSTPVMVDAFIVEFNAKIVELLPWLNNPFGRVQGVTKSLKGRKAIYPSAHTASKEYMEVFPNDKIVNFSWFSIGAEEINSSVRRAKMKVPATFNLFLNLNKIYPDVTASRDLENAKNEVVHALYNLCLKTGALRVNSVSEDYDDVYAGFSVSDLQDMYFMQPYAGLSFSLDLYVKDLSLFCPDPTPVPPDPTTIFYSDDIPGGNIADSVVPKTGDLIRKR